MIHAASGYEMAHLAYQPGRSRPDYCGIYHADVLTGVYAFGAISAALYQRHGTGQGQHIDVSMLESMLSLTLNELQWSQFEVKPTQRPMFGPIETADGYVMVAIASEKTFQSLMKVIGHPEWVSDPRFADYADRRENWASLMEGVEAWSRAVTTEQCLAALNAAGRSRVRPIARWRRRWAIRKSPIAAHWPRSRMAAAPSRCSTCRSACPGPASRRRKRMSTLGEHTVAYLRETGLSEDEIAAFAGKRAGDGAGLTTRPAARQPAAFHPRLSCGLARAGNSSQSAAQSSTIRNTGRQVYRRETSNESGNPLARACANISCRGIWPCLGGKSLVASPASAQKQGGSITVGLELDIPGFDPLKVGVLRHGGADTASARFSTRSPRSTTTA